MWLRSPSKSGCLRRKRRAIATAISNSGMESAISGAVMPRIVAAFWLQTTA